MSNDSRNFLMKLNGCASDKKLLLRMAAEAIAHSHDHRTLAQRRSQDLQFNPTSINLRACIGKIHALNNQNLSTNDKLCMVINEYINLEIKDNPKTHKDTALEHFNQQFLNLYPQQHGAVAKLNNKVNQNDVRIAVG